jgi:PTH1 family peptidyl-tRNA hydrolase
MDAVPGPFAMSAERRRPGRSSAGAVAINKIVIGLGNPGDQYRQTRHNIGWLVLDRLADRAGWTGRGRSRDAAAIVGGRFRGLDLLLVKPMTYMNESGIAVRKVLARERVPLNELLVVVDDFALPFGKLRFREGGGPGGHNGLRSIIGEIESEAFGRLRIGIGEPGRGFKDHVLSRFAPDERQRLDELLDAAADAVESWAREGTNRAATRFNAFELRPADADRLAPPGEVEGPPGPDGIRRTRTGWRKVRPTEEGS